MKRLWIEYIAVWVAAIVLFLAYQNDWLLSGALVNNGMATYIANYTTIAITIGFIYLALKLFVLKGIAARIMQGGERCYLRWAEIRLCMLAIALLLSVNVYQATLEKSGAFCALITAIALLFIVPSRQDMINRTTPQKEEEENVSEGE